MTCIELTGGSPRYTCVIKIIGSQENMMWLIWSGLKLSENLTGEVLNSMSEERQGRRMVGAYKTVPFLLLVTYLNPLTTNYGAGLFQQTTGKVNYHMRFGYTVTLNWLKWNKKPLPWGRGNHKK